MKEKGFVTLAVGDIHYYRLAENLLLSYKRFANDSETPFAIIADKKNKITELFDDVIIITNVRKSYMDKIAMLENPPYKENLFIDADCLAYSNLNEYWKHVLGRGGIRCFGHSYNLDYKGNVWFRPNDVCEYKDKVSYLCNFHGGIIYYCDDELSRNIIKDAKEVAKNYSKYKFLYFEKPADEPILALASTLNNCPPIEIASKEQKRMFCFLPSWPKCEYDISRGYLSYYDGDITNENVLLLHWQNHNTRKPIYYSEILSLKGIARMSNVGRFLYLCYNIQFHLSSLANRVFNKIKRLLKWYE